MSQENVELVLAARDAYNAGHFDAFRSSTRSSGGIYLAIDATPRSARTGHAKTDFGRMVGGVL
jgi:hypothetical protein